MAVALSIGLTQGLASAGDGVVLAARPGWLLAGSTFLGLVLASVLVAIVLIRRDFFAREAIVPAGLFVVALALRFAAHAGPADIRDVAGMLDAPRRAGWSSYLGLVFRLLPPVQESLWNLHRVVGALAVPLLHAVLRRRFAPLAALAGATTLAVLPLVARFDATDTPYVPLCTAFLAALVALDRFARSGSPWTLAFALGLLTLAIQLRPDGPWLVVPTVLLFTCNGVGWRPFLRPSTLALLACFVAVNAPFVSWALLGHRVGGDHAPSELRSFILVGGLFFSPWFDLAASPLPVTLLVVAGGFLASRMGRNGVLWLLATVVAVPVATGAVGQLSHARVHLPSVHLACGLAGVAIAAVIEAITRRRPLPRGVAPALAIVLPAIAALPRVDFLWRMWTPQLEFERFREGIRALGARATVVTLLDVRDGGFVPFSDPGTVDLRDLAEFSDSPPRGPAVVYYYRAANCFVPDAINPDAGPFHLVDGCRAFESGYALSPLWEADLPAIPYRGEVYTRDPIPVGLYRIALRADGTR